MPELIDKQAALDIAMSYCPDDDGFCSKAGHNIIEMLDEIEALQIVHIDDMAFNIQNEIQAEKPSRTVEITFVRHGRWETWGYVFHGIEWKRCSCCGKCADVSYHGLLDGEIKMSTPAICGCCGAKMELRTPTEAQLDEADSVMMGGADNG